MEEKQERNEAMEEEEKTMKCSGANYQQRINVRGSLSSQTISHPQE